MSVPYRARLLASADELDSIEPLWNALREHYDAMDDRPGDVYPRAESWARRRRTYEALLASEDGLFVVLEADGEPVAYAAISVEPSSAAFAWSERAATIETFVVDDRRRGQGLGRRLLDEVRALAAERGADELLLNVLPGNRAAVDFYREQGFRTYCLLLSDAIPAEGDGSA